MRIRTFAVASAVVMTSLTGLSSCVSIADNSKTTVPRNITVADIHPWTGKRVAILGDSMSDPALNITKVKWYEYLKEWLRITPYAYAVNGMQWNDVPRQTDALVKDHGQDVDGILIFMGTNDFNAGVPIGSYYKEEMGEVKATGGAVNGNYQQKRLHRTLVMDPSTICGRINIALSKLKDTYPDKQIVLLTPVHRGFAQFGPDNIQPDELWQNAAGRWFDEYVEAIRQAGGVWSIPVVDLYSDSGYYPNSQSMGDYVHVPTTDRLHASDTGNKRLALTLMYRLLALPCSVR